MCACASCRSLLQAVEAVGACIHALCIELMFCVCFFFFNCGDRISLELIHTTPPSTPRRHIDMTMEIPPTTFGPKWPFHNSQNTRTHTNTHTHTHTPKHTRSNNAPTPTPPNTHKQDPLIDMTMEIPPTTFGPKWPFLNHRYHNRRNAYLSHVASKLEGSGLVK
jgi:hypothetical protein